jgi:type III restriction enzyme
MEDPVVLAKRDVAVTWCKQASDHAGTCGGKSWKYALIPHDAITENMTLKGLAGQFAAPE